MPGLPSASLEGLIPDHPHRANELQLPEHTLSEAPLASGLLPDQMSEVKKPFEFQVPEGAITDPEGEALSFTATLADGSELPSWLQFDAGKRKFAGTPPEQGAQRISVAAKDPDGNSAETGFMLTVGPGPKPLVAQGLPSISATAGEFFSEVVPRTAITDPDGDILSFGLSPKEGNLPEWLHFDPQAMVISGIPDKEQRLRMSLEGKDKDGHSATTDLDLDIKAGGLGGTSGRQCCLHTR